MQKFLDTVCVLILILAGGMYLFGQFTPHPLGNIVNQPLFTSMTNATTSIGRVSPTTVFDTDTYHNYARINNYNSEEISCYLESKTTASSSLALGAGITIGKASSTAFTGEPSICFGSASGCIPYIGKINCIGKTTTTVGITYN